MTIRLTQEKPNLSGRSNGRSQRVPISLTLSPGIVLRRWMREDRVTPGILTDIVEEEKKENKEKSLRNTS